VVRITASDVPAITEVCPKHWGTSPKQVVEKKQQWDASLCKGETPDYDEGFLQAALGRMQFGAAQEGPEVEQYLQRMQQYYTDMTPGGDWNFQAQETGLIVHPKDPWIAASPDRFIIASGSKAAAGQLSTQEWLLEVKVCVSSDLPADDSLPVHVLQQVLVQLECTQRTQAHVWFAKAGHPGKLFIVYYDSNADQTTIITNGGQSQQLYGVWREIHRRLAWTYFQQLAPALILQRARLGVIPRDKLPTATAARGEFSAVAATTFDGQYSTSLAGLPCRSELMHVV
jgi:hypothetical protein